MIESTGTILDNIDVTKLGINKKLLAIQRLMPRIDKDAQNEFFSKGAKVAKYTTLANVLSVILPLLNNHNILFSSEQKHIENIGWAIIVQLIDVDTGEIKSTTLPLLNVADMQKMGGCITYGQRYGLLPMLGIAPELDDDGNGASTPKDRYVKKPQEINVEEEVKFKTQLRNLFMANEERLKSVDEEKYNTIKNSLNENIGIDAIKRRLSWVEECLKAKV